MNKKQTIKLNENQFNNFVKKIVTEAVKKVLNEIGETEHGQYKDNVDDDFTFGPSHMTNRNTHRQVISYKGREIGYLLYIEHGGKMSWLLPVDEIWVLPDVDYGMDTPEDRSGLLDGKQGWIDFKRFKNDSDAAIAYVKQNFEKIAYLFEYGDYD